ncbi:MAG TPA: hypothetical protein VMJ32_15030, partial [Pirellulales bacterium]|nr:hypothetical protein [Pirellulales bacterium]
MDTCRFARFLRFQATRGLFLRVVDSWHTFCLFNTPAVAYSTQYSCGVGISAASTAQPPKSALESTPLF